MKCPNCGLANPDDAVKCNCGYSLTTHRFYRSYEHMRLTEFFSNSWRTFGANWTTFLILAAIPTIVSSTLALASGVEIGVIVGNPLIGFSEPTPEWAGAIQLYGQIISEGLFVIFNVLLFKSLRALAIDEKALRKAEDYAEDENLINEKTPGKSTTIN